MNYFIILLVAIFLTSSFFFIGALSLTKVGFLLFLVLFLLMFLKNRKLSIKVDVLDVSIFLTLVLAIFSQYRTADLNESWPIVQSYIYYFILYGVTRIYFYNYPRYINIALKSLVIAVLVSCVFGILQFVTGFGYMPGTPIRSISTGGVFRACGLFDDPNYFGLVLACVWPFCLIFKNVKLKYVFCSIFILSILLTLSRATLLILLIQVVFIFHSKSSDKSLFIIRLLIIMAFAIPLFIVIKPAFLIERMSTLLPLISGNIGELENSSAERVDLIFSGINMFLDYPFLGLGFGNFQLYTEQYMSFFPRKVFAHNSYLTVLAELGILGFTIWFIPLFITFKRLNKESCIFGACLIGLFLSYFFLVAIYFQFIAFFLALLITSYQKGLIGIIKL